VTAAHDDAPVLKLTGGNGDEIVLTGYGNGFGAADKTNGIFGTPTPTVRQLAGAGDGATWGGTIRGPRAVDIGVSVYSDTAAEQRVKLARLGDLLDDTHGPTRLTVTCPERGTDAARWIDLHYTGGFEGDTSDSQPGFLQIPLSFVGLDPYFRAATPVTVTWRTGGELQPFLSATSPFLPIKLAPSQVLGQVQLVNPGDVASYAVWRILGPGGPITANPATGRGWTIDTVIEAQDVLFVDGQSDRPLTTYELDDAGNSVEVDAYDLFGPAPRLWLIPPGDSTAGVAVVGATADTEVLLQFWPRYKLGA